MIRAFGPGRVNLIGEHTDYNGGVALPFAIEQGVRVELEPGPGERLRVEARDLGEEDEFSVDHPGGARGWRAYVRGTVAELRAGGAAVPGGRLAITSDLPRGGGLSSSAALTAAPAR